MVAKQQRHTVQDFLDGPLLLLVRVQDVQKLFVRFRFVRKPPLNFRHVLNRVPKLQRRVFCGGGRRPRRHAATAGLRTRALCVRHHHGVGGAGTSRSSRSSGFVHDLNFVPGRQKGVEAENEVVVAFEQLRHPENDAGGVDAGRNIGGCTGECHGRGGRGGARERAYTNTHACALKFFMMSRNWL